MVGVMMRIAGCMMIVAGTSAYGFWMSRRYAQQLAELEQLRHMIFLLKGQILYANAPLHEAFDAVGRRSSGTLAQLFVRVTERIERQKGEAFSTMWEEEVDQLGETSVLSKADRQNLKSLGEHLGFLDCEMQERNLLLYLEQLDFRIQDMREHRQERCRLYSSLGVMSGMFVAILLI